MTNGEAANFIKAKMNMNQAVFGHPVGEPLKTAYEMAISALEKQERERWRKFTRRKPEEWEGDSYDYILDCDIPENDQPILVTINMHGHERVQADVFMVGGGEECCLDSGYDLVDEAIAWRPLPEPYAEEES